MSIPIPFDFSLRLKFRSLTPYVSVTPFPSSSFCLSPLRSNLSPALGSNRSHSRRLLSLSRLFLPLPAWLRLYFDISFCLSIFPPNPQPYPYHFLPNLLSSGTKLSTLMLPSSKASTLRHSPLRLPRPHFPQKTVARHCSRTPSQPVTTSVCHCSPPLPAKSPHHHFIFYIAPSLIPPSPPLVISSSPPRIPNSHLFSPNPPP